MDKPHKIPEGTPGYETSDANAGGILKFLIFLALLLIVSGLVCWGFFRFLAAQTNDSDANSPFADSRQLPLGPQLQVNPREDLLKYREDQQHSLETYSWENRGAGIVHVPIERAMELLLQKGLPVQSQPSAVASDKEKAMPDNPASDLPAKQEGQKP